MEDATPHSQDKVNANKIKIDNVLIEKTLKFDIQIKVISPKLMIPSKHSAVSQVI